MRKIKILLVCITLYTSNAMGGICDYVPSKYISNSGASAVSAVAGATATTGIGMNVAGFYTLTHSASGLVMLGSTSAGTSAAGTIGIIANTSGAIGSASAVAMSSLVIVPAVIIAVSIVAYEGSCYLTAL